MSFCWQWNLFNYSSSPYVGCGAGVIRKLDPVVLGYKNIFCWLKPVPCGNVLMWSLKHVLRNAVNTYSSLSGLSLVRNTQELSLSACGLPHGLPFAFRSGLAVFNEAEVTEWGRNHQHCLSREDFPSDKLLNQLPCSEAQALATSLPPGRSLTEKQGLNVESKGAYPKTTWKAEVDCKSPG